MRLLVAASREQGDVTTMASRRIDELIDIVFPTACMGCGAPGGRLICDRCVRAMVLCRPCSGQGFEAGRPGGWSPSFDAVVAASWYRGLAREALLRLKSSCRPAADPLALAMVAAAGNDPLFVAPDFVCFVPSTRAKVVERGYNPAELLARRVARMIGRPVLDCIEKSRVTRDQDSLSGQDRTHNVAGAFRPARTVRQGAAALLVDDVITTGSTADSCALAVLESGAGEVRVLVAARAYLRGPGASSMYQSQVPPSLPRRPTADFS